MNLRIQSAIVLIMLASAAASSAESARDIVDAAWEAQLGRWEGLDAYLVEQTVMGNATKQFFLRTVITNDDGTERVMFVPSSKPVLKSGCVETAAITDAMSNEAGDNSDYFRWFMEDAELVGEELIDDTATWHLRAENPGGTQTMNGQTVTIRSMSLWLSKDEYLPIKAKFAGESIIDGQSQPVTIETLHSDFRTVAGTRLHEPFRRVMRISGMTAGLDKEQIAEARAQLEKMQTQMANMPEAQRKMMEKMMGPQLETIRKLAESGSIETEILVNSITPNPEINGTKAVACDVG